MAGDGTCFHIKNCFLVVFVCLLACFFPPKNLGPISLGLRNGNLWSILEVISVANHDLGSLNQLLFIVRHIEVVHTYCSYVDSSLLEISKKF